VDDTGIPTGTIKDYPGIEANKEYVLGEQQPDPDDCFVMNTDPSSIPLDTRSEPLKLLGHFRESEKGGINLEVHSTEPAFQYYTGKYIEVPAIPEAKLPARGPRSGFCVEPSRYVNAVNVDDWKNMVLLKKGEVYGSRNMYRAWVE
jgi:aldose 1-epimerase